MTPNLARVICTLTLGCVVAGCAATGNPATAVADPTAILPSPSAPRAVFRSVGNLTYPGSAHVGGIITLTLSVDNVSPVRGNLWVAISDLTASAPLIGCKPKCIASPPTESGLEYLEFDALAPGAMAEYTMNFRAEMAGSVSFVVLVSGVAHPLVSEADVEWAPTTLIQP